MFRHVRVCAIERIHGNNKTKEVKKTKSHVTNVHWLYNIEKPKIFCIYQTLLLTGLQLEAMAFLASGNRRCPFAKSCPQIY